MSAQYSQVKGFETPGGSIRDGAQTPMHELGGSSSYPPTPGANSALLPDNDNQYYAYSGKKSAAAASNKKKWIIGGVLAAIVVLIIVIAVPVAVTQNKSSSGSKDDSSSGGHGGNGNGGGDNNPLSKVAQYGADGSTVTMENGNQFTYQNKLGGFWVSTPGNNSAQAQSYAPPISETWDYTKNRILGVNLGGWLVIEPFIVPALFEPFANTSNVISDEYGLSQYYLQNGGQANLESKMREHYDTFITEQDFAEIAGAGLNWVRLPVGYWAVETIDGEPYLEGVAWEYVVKAIGWARKYGIRINLDLHAVPGSQNGNNHSGHQGVIGWLYGVFGYANAQRTFNIIRAMTEFISQPDVSPVVPFFSVMNEPQLNTIGINNAMAFFGRVYTMMREITGMGNGVGPYMMLHSGFVGNGVDAWANYLRGSDRVAYDFHPYLAFNPPYSDSWSSNLPKPCRYFGPNEDSGLSNVGLTVSGEWSLAINDCALYLNNVGAGYRYEGNYDGSGGESYGSCAQAEAYEGFSDSYKANMKAAALGWMDALHHQFFWTWHIGNSTVTGKPSAPFWNYKLGIQEGWMPENPNEEQIGACSSIGSSLGVDMPSTSWGSTFQDWMTGASTAQFYANPSQYNPWPVSSVSNAGVDVTQGPSLTTTGDTSSLYLTTGASTKVTASTKGQTFPTLSAWYDAQDTAAPYTRISGCNYPSNVYSLNNYDASGWPCSGGGNSKREPTPVAQPPVEPRTLATPAPVARGPASMAREY